MSSTLEFLPEAKGDAEEATRYYEKRVPGLGARFRKELENVWSSQWGHKPNGVTQTKWSQALGFGVNRLMG